jgi:microcompartment protein CcmL/EutN
MQEPALGIIEFKSIARGLFAADAIAKKAPVKILSTNSICPGKYLIIFSGEVADVEESLLAGISAGGDMVIHYLFLPFVHRDVIPALSGTSEIKVFGALGIIESFSVSTCIAAADKAVKIAPIKLIEIRLANGIGGKGYFILTGELSDVEVACNAAKEYISAEGLLAGCEVIASPHKDLLRKLNCYSIGN